MSCQEVVSGSGEPAVPSTIETLERELGEAQAEREREERSVLRAENAHEAACAARDEAWSEGFATDPEVERLTALVYHEAQGALRGHRPAQGGRGQGAEDQEPPHVRPPRGAPPLPPRRRRRGVRGTSGGPQGGYEDSLPDARVCVVTEKPGEVDLRGDATWRALERLYSGTVRRWVEVRCGGPSPRRGAGWPARSATTPAATPRGSSSGDEEIKVGGRGSGGLRPLPGYESAEGRLAPGAHNRQALPRRDLRLPAAQAPPDPDRRSPR